MTKEQINEKFFESLFEQQMSEIDGRMFGIQDKDRHIIEAHEIITTLLFEWETNNKDQSITDRAIKWLSKNSKI
tara:strand:- start:433 stop:654 length:222 start_codon:yes stop_codon:yes gene_type:complete